MTIPKGFLLVEEKWLKKQIKEADKTAYELNDSGSIDGLEYSGKASAFQDVIWHGQENNKRFKNETNSSGK